ncbi:MAG: hypothetical protein KAR32_03145 [Candidatus Omnitrophica bacterium]|nr:hypothetical protein [Candidatus Omnitrophota bacterium]
MSALKKRINVPRSGSVLQQLIEVMKNTKNFVETSKHFVFSINKKADLKRSAFIVDWLRGQDLLAGRL